MQIVRSVNSQTRNAHLIKNEIEHLDRTVFTGRRAVDSPLTKNEWNEIWASKRYKVYFVRDQKTESIVGYVVIKRTRTKNIYIDTLGVHPEFRKNGIATRLLTEILSKYQRFDDVEKASLHVSVENESALRLYKSMSFEVQKKVRHFYARGDDAFYLQFKSRLITMREPYDLI